jgi:hypothetical protein
VQEALLDGAFVAVWTTQAEPFVIALRASATHVVAPAVECTPALGHHRHGWPT